MLCLFFPSVCGEHLKEQRLAEADEADVRDGGTTDREAKLQALESK